MGRQGCGLRVVSLVAAMVMPAILLSAPLFSAPAPGDEAVKKRYEELQARKQALEKSTGVVKGFLAKLGPLQEILNGALNGLDRFIIETAGPSTMEGLDGAFRKAVDVDRTTAALRSLSREAASLAGAGLPSAIADEAKGLKAKTDEAVGLLEKMKAVADMGSGQVEERMGQENKGLLDVVRNNKEQLDLILVQRKTMYLRQAADPFVKVLKEIQGSNGHLAQELNSFSHAVREDGAKITLEMEYVRRNHPFVEKQEGKP
jgi:hypothetical protein